MASEDGNPTASALESFIKERFVSCDNLQRNVAWENARIMEDKASLLILSSVGGGRFAPFIKSWNSSKDTLHFENKKFPTRCVIPRGQHSYEFTSGKFSVKTGLPEERFRVAGNSDVAGDVICPEVDDGICCNGRLIAKGNDFYPTDEDTSILFNNISDALKYAFHCRTLFDLLKEFTPYDTPEKVCRYFGIDWTPYGAWKDSISGMRLDKFHDAPACRDAESWKLSQDSSVQQKAHSPSVLETKWCFQKNFSHLNDRIYV